MIYVYVNGSRRGPFQQEQVQSFLRDGLLQATDLASDGKEGELKALAAFESPRPAPVATPATVSPPEIAMTAPPVAPVQPPPHVPAPQRFPALSRQLLGPYARSTLAPNETPYYKTSLHWIIFVRFAVLAALACLFIAMPFAIGVQALTASQIGWFTLPLPAFMLIPPTLAYISSELVITDARVLIKTGIIQRQTLEMFISKVESIAINQGFIARLFDYGTVTIRGTGGFEEPFEAIARPVEFRNWVQRMQKSGETVRSSPT